MGEIICTMFGVPSVRLDGRSINLPYKKADALLYYILLKRKAFRTELADLLWTEDDPTTALRNLRHAVFSIRKEFGAELFVSGQRAALELNPDLHIWCDVWNFEEKGELSVYRGEFLQGFSVTHADRFDEWLTDMRSVYQAKFLHTLLMAQTEAFRSGDYETAEQFGLRCLEADPLEESAARTLMRIYSVQKKYRKAMGVYHALCKSLSDELAISPLKETTNLYYSIVSEWNASTYLPGQESSGWQPIGKDKLIGRLLAFCNVPDSGQKMHGVLVQGESGVGKSYALSYLLSQYDFSDRIICKAYCYRSECTTVLSPWNTVMLSLLREIEEKKIFVSDIYLEKASVLFPCLRVRERNAGMPELPMQVDYAAAEESALMLIASAARVQPILLIFEDIHWMDKASFSMLSKLLHQFRDADFRLLCTARPTDNSDTADFLRECTRDGLLETVPLHNFTEAEAACLIRRFLGEDSPKEVCQQIFHATNGNALMLIQLLTAMKERGADLQQFEGVDDIITQRIEDLTMTERQLLETISVLDGAAMYEMLESILTRDTLELAYLCDRLKQKALLSEVTENGKLGYGFSHERIRGLVRAGLSETSRRILHLRVAQYLETELQKGDQSVFGKLIRHCEAGGDRFRTLKYKILNLDAFAGICYELLPTLPEQDTDPAADGEGLIAYIELLKRHIQDLQLTSFEANDRELKELEWTLLYTESRHHIHYGNYEKALPLLDSLLYRSRECGNRKKEIQIHLQYIYYAVQVYDLAVMQEHLAFGEQYNDFLQNSADFGTYLRLKGLYHIMCGEFLQGRHVLEHAAAVFEKKNIETGERYAIALAGVYNYIGESYRLERNYEKAFDCYNQAIIYNRIRGSYPGSAVFYTNYGVAAFQSHRYYEARQLFLYADETYRSFYEYSEYPIALAYLAWFDVTDGAFDSGVTRLKTALELCDKIGSPWWRGIVIYLMWKIRSFLAERGIKAPLLSDLWPTDEREHCLWGLSYLRQIEPCIETQELENALQKL